MSHCIEKIDKVLVPEGESYRAWHGLETVVGKRVTKDSAKDLHFPIVCHEVMGRDTMGNLSSISGFKAVAADVRKRDDIPGDFVYLNIPRDNYRDIPNDKVWNTMEKSLDSVGGYKVSCAGTLGGLSRYFISVEVGELSEMMVNGDKFRTHLNFITSHDGTLALSIHDSNIRIVCQNTLNWSMAQKKNMSIRISHHKNAGEKIKRFEVMFEEIVKGRKTFKEMMESIDAIDMDEEEARGVVGGYYSKLPSFNKTTGFSTRSRNTVDDVVNLFSNGTGNRGKTVYDIFNAFTENYTSGSGVGRNPTPSNLGKRVFTSSFGTASTHKSNFTKILLENARNGTLKKFADEGNKALAITTNN